MVNREPGNLARSTQIPGVAVPQPLAVVALSSVPASTQSPDVHRLGVAFHRRWAELRRGPGCVADCRNYRIGHDEAGVVFLRELLEPRSKIHGVADRSELLAPRRADIAGDGVAYVRPDANPQR